MPRDRFYKQSLGNLHQTIQQSRVLLVGAGGIGCELLKNLVLTGFGEIDIIDLDTIDLSNLNRQFLFRQEHIKKAKAIVAKEVAQKFNTNVKLNANHANIKDPQFDVNWFSQFKLVFNALDNLDARRHVNRMCLAADVPLIESGTTGFNGQVQVIKKGTTACYDCTPKSTPKTFPVCTIRSTPSQPIHCIVWAKSYLLPELFGESEESTPEVDTSTDTDNAKEIAKLKEEADALKNIRASMGSDTFAKNVFDKVFKDDVERLANMEDMWTNGRTPPTPLSFDALSKEVESSTVEPDIHHVDQRTWTLPETFVVFNSALSRLSSRYMAEPGSPPDNNRSAPIITFDKDDDTTLSFVAAAANLRSHIFGIERKSQFDVKQMAGNIIPAIATTNAMIAGLCVLQSFKVMKGEYDKSKMIFLDRGNMSAGQVDAPNPDCAICSVAMLRAEVVLQKASLGDLVSRLRTQLNYGTEISILNGDGGIVFEPDMEDNLDKKFGEVNITHGSFVIVKDDADDDPRIDLQVYVEDVPTSADDSVLVKFVLGEGDDFEIAKKPAKKAIEPLEVVPETAVTGKTEVNGTSATSTVTKRKREADDEADGAAPVKKVQSEATKGTTDKTGVILVDEEEGAIEIN